MKIIDWYILKRYLTTFMFTLLILIPIAVAIDIAEKIDKFLKHEDLTFIEVVDDYYKNFIIYYGNTFMPLALFIAVIIFTSRLANNTEVIAINGAQISFTRFLYPYFIGSTIITIFALGMNHFVVPNSTKVRNNFENKYLTRKKYSDTNISDFSLQLNDSTYIFLQSFDLKRNSGYLFSQEIYDKNAKINYQLTAETIKWKPKDSTFTLHGWKKRKVNPSQDYIATGNKLDTIFDFTPKDLNYKSTQSLEMQTPQLIKLINLSTKRGVKNLNSYKVELYKRTSLPLASYILTLIAVALSYQKKRGGIGMSLAVGIGVMFIYVFFLKVGEVLGAVAGANALLNVWMPNVIFGLYATYLYLKARK